MALLVKDFGSITISSDFSDEFPSFIVVDSFSISERTSSWTFADSLAIPEHISPSIFADSLEIFEEIFVSLDKLLDEVLLVD
jgi:hypothetical protein